MSLETADGGASPVTFPLSPKVAEVARCLQGDIPLTLRPFERIAHTLGLNEAAVLAIAAGLRQQGIIRKFGAIVRHQLAGYRHNIMVLWAVPPERCQDAGRRLAAFPEVTHCYERTPPFAQKYNLFTMVHFHRETDEALLGRLADAAGIGDFKILRSLEEFKKSSMEYF